MELTVPVSQLIKKFPALYYHVYKSLTLVLILNKHVAIIHVHRNEFVRFNSFRTFYPFATITFWWCSKASTFVSYHQLKPVSQLRILFGIIKTRNF
jgi:hypothetical protein